MAQMLAMVCNEHQNDWDVHLTHVKYAYNNSDSAARALGYHFLNLKDQHARSYKAQLGNQWFNVHVETCDECEIKLSRVL